MPSKDESATSKEPTLKDIDEKLSGIEKSLKCQRMEAAQGVLRTVAFFGGSIIMVGIGLWVERYASSFICFRVACAFLFVYGFVVMAWALHQYLRIKSRS